jgi:histidine phosphotransfer protein HptB
MTDYPIVDEHVLNGLGVELGLEDAIAVLKTFLADTAQKVDTIAGSRMSRLATKREAHSIKSSAAIFGFERLSQMARELEGGAETLGDDPLDRSIAALRQAFAETASFAEYELLPSLRELP